MTNNISNLFNKHFNWNTTGENKSDSTKKVTKEEENILKKPIKEIIDLFIKGNMTLEELVLWCNGNNCDVTSAKESSTLYTISFKYQGKSYKIASNINAAQSSTDHITVKTFLLEELKDKYKLNDETISSYFDEVANVDKVEKQYAFKSSYASKFASIDDFITYLCNKNNLVMYNYIKNQTRDKNGVASAAALYTNTLNKKLTTSNYAQYTDKINNLTGANTKTIKQQAFYKFINEFSSGKINYDQIDTVLDAIGIGSEKFVLENGNGVIKFNFEGKFYSIKTTSTQVNDKLKADSEERKNIAAELISEAADNFKNNPDFAIRIKDDIQAAYDEFINLKITESNFKSAIKTVTTALQNELKRLNYAESRNNAYTEKLANYAGAAKAYQTETTQCTKDYIAGTISKDDFKKLTSETYSRLYNIGKRLNYAESRNNTYIEKLASYKGAGEQYAQKIANCTNDYMTGKLSISEFKSQTTVIYNDIKKAHKRAYAEEQVNTFKDSFKDYENGLERFKQNAETDIINYSEGKISSSTLKKNLKKVVESTIKTLEAEAKAKAERTAYANQTVENYKNQLKNFDGAGDAFVNNTNDIVSQYVSGNLNSKTFDSNLKKIFDEIKAEETKKAEAKAKAERTAYANQTVENYKNQLKNFDGAGDAFVNNTNDIVSQYVSGNLNSKTFESNLKKIFDEIKAEETKKAEEKAKAERTAYAEAEVAKVKNIEKYKFAANDYDNLLEREVNRYINGIVSKSDFDTNIKNYAENIKDLITKEVETRTNNADINYNDYIKELQEFEDAKKEFEEAEKEYRKQYLAGDIDYVDYCGKRVQKYSDLLVNEYKTLLKGHKDAIEFFENRVADINSRRAYSLHIEIKNKFEGAEFTIRRKELADTLIGNYKEQLEDYDGAANEFDRLAKTARGNYLTPGNNVDDSAFETQIETIFETIKAKYELAERTAYAESEVEKVKDIDNYSLIQETYDSKLLDLVNKHINNILDKTKFDEQLLALAKEISNAIAKTIQEIEEKAKAERTAYAENEIKTVQNTSNYNLVQDTYDCQLFDLAKKHINNILDKIKFDDLLLALAKEVSGAIANVIEKARRTEHAKTVLDGHRKNLEKYEGAVDKFNKATAGIEADYLNKTIDDTTFNKKVQEQFNNIKYECTTTTETAADGTKTVTTTNDDGTKTRQKYDANGNLTQETFYDTKGKTTQVKNYYTNGTLKSETMYDTDGKTKLFTKSYTYDSNKKLTNKVTKNYKADGSYTQYSYTASTGAVVRDDYDKNGKKTTKSASEQLSGTSTSVSYEGLTEGFTGKEIYDAIINVETSNLKIKRIFSIGTRYAIKNFVGEHTYNLLKASNIGKKPAGISKTYSSLADTGHEEQIKRKILNSITKDYGYDPEDVKGYHFSSSSSLSKAMAQNNDMKTFVKNNIKDLINGTNLPKGMQFKSSTDKDLYYAISWCEVLGAKLDGTNLILTTCDVYDFAPETLEKAKKGDKGFGTVICAAAVVGINTGKIIPYYYTNEVKIDLTTIFSNNELKSLGIIK